MFGQPEQIQSRPTPFLWWGGERGPVTVQERGNAGVSLAGLVSYITLEENAGTEPGSAAFALVSFNVNGPIEETLTEPGNGAFALNSFRYVAPTVDGPETEEIPAALAVNSFQYYPAQVTGPETETATGAFALQSFVYTP